jgi:S1-C subfamily serine protease
MARYTGWSLIVAAAACGFLVAGVPSARADQPKLGIEGEMVPVPGQFQFGIGAGYRIDRVYWGSHAARMGLERGDIIVLIDNMWFQDCEAFRAALRQTGTTVRLAVINVRTGRLTWLHYRLNHDPRPHYGEAIPDSLGFVN